MNPVRVWVTRDEPEDGELGAALRSAGLEPVWHPVLARRLRADALGLLEELGEQDWLVLMSRYAIEAIPAASVRSRVAALGPTTAGALRRLGIDAWVEVRDATFEEFAGAIAGKLRDREVTSRRE